MKIDDKIKDEKIQNYVNREAAKILASGKTDKYEYLTVDKISPSDQSRIKVQAKFTYSPLRKAFEKQINIIENQGEKQITAIEEHGKQLPKSNQF